MNNEEKKAIEKLKERVKTDRQLRDKVESDFDKFCEDECMAIETVLNLICKQNKVIDEMAKTIIKERGYKNIDEHPEWIENTKRFFFKKVENDERREKLIRKAKDETTD